MLKARYLLVWVRVHFGAVLAVLALVQATTLLLLQPGALSIDEVTYHAMTHSLVTGHPFTVDNGAGLVSPELEWSSVAYVNGRLVSQYPEGMPLVGAPFYAIFGFAGLFVMNTLAFYVTVYFCRAIAREALRKEGAAFLAAIVFMCATFAWEYGAGAWPHSLATMLGTLAVHEVIVGARESSNRRAALRRFVGGFFVGVGCTVRLDAAFLLLPLLLMPALLRRTGEPRWRASLGVIAVLAGLLPSCAFLALTNHRKFGTWQPFSYGPWQANDSNTGAAQYVALAIGASVVLVGAHVLLLRAHRRAPRSFVVQGVMGAAVLAILTVSVQPLRAVALRTLEGLWMLLVDMRARDLGWLEPALTRSPGGGMVYVRTLKTSLLQSCPYLPLALVAILARAAPAQRPRRKVAIALPVLTYFGVFSYFRWHGGLSVNLRYFVPTLPFIAILATDGLLWLRRRCAPAIRSARASVGIVLSTMAMYIVALVAAHPPTASWAVRETFYLDFPLGIAAIAGAATAAVRAGGRATRTWAAAVGFTFGVMGLVWGGLTEFTYDVPAVVRTRMYGQVTAGLSRPLIPHGSLVLVDYADRAALLIEDDIVVAHGARDDFRAAPRLVAAMACRSQKSFAVMRCGAWEKLAPRLASGAVTFDVLVESSTEDLVIAALHAPYAPCEHHGPSAEPAIR